MKELDAVKFIEERLSDEEGQIFLYLLATKLQNESFKMDDHFKEKLGVNNGLMDLFWTIQEEVCPLVANTPAVVVVVNVSLLEDTSSTNALKSLESTLTTLLEFPLLVAAEADAFVTFKLSNAIILYLLLILFLIDLC